MTTVGIVGFGSIAKKHITALNSLLPSPDITLIDSSSVNSSFPVVSSSSLNNRFFDLIIVSTPAHVHLSSFSKLLPYSDKFLLEKPLCLVEQLDNLLCIHL